MIKYKARLSITYQKSCFEKSELQEIENDLNTYGIELTANERSWRINASLDFFVPIIEFILSPDFPTEVCKTLAVSGVIHIMSRIYKKFHHRPMKKIQANQISDVPANVHFRIGNDALVLPIDAEYSKYIVAVDKFVEIAGKSRSTENTYVFFDEKGDRLIAKTAKQIITEEYERQRVLDEANVFTKNDEIAEGVEMVQKETKEHVLKETLKSIVDNSPNYTEQMKVDLKNIIDLGSTPEEILKACMVYFSM